MRPVLGHAGPLLLWRAASCPSRSANTATPSPPRPSRGVRSSWHHPGRRINRHSRTTCAPRFSSIRFLRGRSPPRPRRSTVERDLAETFRFAPWHLLPNSFRRRRQSLTGPRGHDSKPSACPAGWSKRPWRPSVRSRMPRDNQYGSHTDYRAIQHITRWFIPTLGDFVLALCARAFAVRALCYRRLARAIELQAMPDDVIT